MFLWYVINTYSGHENKVKTNLEHRIVSMNQQPRVPARRRADRAGHRDEGRPEGADREARAPRLRAREHEHVRRGLDGREGHARRDRRSSAPARSPCRSRSPRSTASCTAARRRGGGPAPKSQVEFSLGESVKVTSGPLSDFDGEIVDVNADQQKLKVLVDIFERQVPVELSFDQVKKID